MKSNLVLLALILASCQPEMPVTSSILVKGDGLTVPVNKELYGLTIEEINHAVDGGIYAELELPVRPCPPGSDYPEWMDYSFLAF